MPFAIMRTEKRKAQAIPGIQKENNRESKDLPRSDIDWNRTKDNVYLVHAQNVKTAIDEHLKAHGITKTRKDAVKMLDTVYTASPEFFKAKTKDEIMEYFKDCLNFHNSTYGNHTVNAVVHFDETTPHMHVLSVPLIRKSMGVEAIGGISVPKPAEWRLCAKDLMGGPEQYRERQDSFYDAVGKKHGLDRGVNTPTRDEIKKHKDQVVHRMEALEKELNEVRKRGFKEGERKAYKQLNDLFQQAKEYVSDIVKRAEAIEADAETMQELQNMEDELDGFDYDWSE